MAGTADGIMFPTKKGKKLVGGKKHKKLFLYSLTPTLQSGKRMKACFDPVPCNVTEMDESHEGSCFDFQHIKINLIPSPTFAANVKCWEDKL